jgi:putative glutamine amidotransferase
VADPLQHEQPNPRTEPGHDVVIAPGTLLHKIAGRDRIPVNSAHHQAVKDLPANITVNARAEDGVVEGVEDPARRFCIGVQWHPEYRISPADAALFTAFIEACR